MANVSKIFKPRRGTKSIMAGIKKSTVLASGEIFVEVPDAGVGKGASKIKIGDGTTAYSSLPYALGDTSNDQITFSSNTSTTVAAALNSVASGGSLKNIVAGLKQAISLCNTSITKLNDDLGVIGGSDMTIHEKLDYLMENRTSGVVDIFPIIDGSISNGAGGTKTETYRIEHSGKLFYKISVSVNGLTPKVIFKINGTIIAQQSVTPATITGEIVVNKDDVVEITFVYGTANRILVLAYLR